jgi:syringomycin synthetase protein SyrE
LTAFTVILTALAIYYARTRNRSQVLIGIPSLNRRGERYLATPGMFVGVAPLAIPVDVTSNVGEQLNRANGPIRDALKHPGYPLSELSRALQATGSSSNGLFDILLSFERQNYAVTFGDARLADSRQLFSGIARYPLCVTVCEFHSDQDLELVLEGSAACFEAREVELLSRRIWHLVTAMMRSPEQAVGEIEILPPEERLALIGGLHQNVAHLDHPRPFISLFQEQAALNPEAIALVHDGGEMNYGELERRSRLLAHRLLRQDVVPGSIVAMVLEREPEMVVSILAIARVRSAFLPLDADAPLARLRDIVKESGARVLLVQARNRERLAALHGRVLVVDDESDYLGEAPPLTVSPPRPDDLAYVLLTSGSTGRPKGVMIEHAALSRRLAWLSKTYAVKGTDRSGQATQYTFDPALIEICLPLIHGASVALPPPGRLPARTLADFVITHRVTIMAFVPSTLQSFLDALDDRPGLCLRVACCGGEVLRPELANRFLRETGARLYNVYGPTEATIMATAWLCEPSREDLPLVIGRPIDDSRIYVLDNRLKPLPFGERGEICIGGQAIARGYLKCPELDREAFLDDPFCPDGRMYRSGDDGWLDSDGSLHFLGRKDRQIKHRGYRIELGEIEEALHAVEGVRRAAAKLLAIDGREAIHAWVAADSAMDPKVLRQCLRDRLPIYMLPAGISILSSLPESPSGKIDYETLPPPQRRESPSCQRPPCGKLERELIALWERVLEKSPLSVTDDFFEAGGDSLKAIDILLGVEKRLGRKLPLYLLIENPTIKDFASALGENTGTTPLLYRLGGEFGQPPLYLAASGHGDLLRFQALARVLEQAFDVYLLQPPDDVAAPTMGDLADLYADRIHARGGAQGYLAGFSVGGIAALETARRLQERGVPALGLILIDTVYPSAFVRACSLWRLFGWLTSRLHIQELSINGRRLGAMFSDPGLTAQVMALRNYDPTPYSGQTLLIKSSGLINWERWLFRRWRRLMIEGLTEKEAPGLHGSLFESGNVDTLAAVLASLVRPSPEKQGDGQ